MINKLYKILFPYDHDELNFYYQKEINYIYDTDIIISKIPDLKWYIRETIKGKAYKLTVCSIYKGIHLPIIDADSEQKMISASLWLKENKVAHSIMTSSIGSYWIIVDRPNKKFRKIVGWIESVPGQDEDFIRFTKRHGMCHIRAKMKNNYFIPNIIQRSGSELIDEFCDKLIDHFSSDLIKWLHRYELYKSGNIDISCPNEINIDFTIDDVLK